MKPNPHRNSSEISTVPEQSPKIDLRAAYVELIHAYFDLSCNDADQQTTNENLTEQDTRNDKRLQKTSK
jgi:hypothetical protein